MPAPDPFNSNFLRVLADTLRLTWARWRWRLQPSNATDERLSAAPTDPLAAVRGTNNWRSIPSLLHILAHENAELRQAGASVINDLAASIPLAALPGFGDRVCDSIMQAYAWNRLRVDWVVTQKWPPRVWAMFTMHSSGYIREVALHALASEGASISSLPYLLLRANDWVDQVRTVATDSLKTFLVPEHAAAWVPVLGLVDRLSLRSRADHTWLTEAVTSLLLLPTSRSALMEAIRSQDRLVARWAFRAAMTLPEADRAIFVSLALACGDPVVRLHAAKAVRAWAQCPGREQLLATMASDCFMPIRREALYAALDETPERRRSVLRASLLDRHASMRHAARVYSRDLPDESGEHPDIRAFYLDALANGPATTRAAAILGIGECGTKADAETLAPFASDNRPTIAAAAVRAVAALDRDHHVAWFIDRLRDTRPCVAREAARALEPLANAAPTEALRQILHSAPSEHSRRYALRILLRRHPYDAVVDAISAAVSPNPALARTGADYIEQARAPRGSYEPSAAQKTAAASAIKNLPTPLPENLRLHVRHFMGV